MTTDFELVTLPDGDNPNVWDLKLVNGDLQLVTGTDAIGQHIRERLQFFFGEWFLDQTLGVPWFQRVFVKGVNEAYVRSILSRVIAGTPGIVSCENVSFLINGATRVASIAYEAITTDGSTITAEDFQPLRIED